MIAILLLCLSPSFRRWYRADTARIQAEADRLHERNEQLRRVIYGGK